MGLASVKVGVGFGWGRSRFGLGLASIGLLGFNLSWLGLKVVSVEFVLVLGRVGLG